MSSIFIMRIKALLENKTNGEKHRIKVDEHCAIKPFTYTMGDFQIKIKSIEKEIEGEQIGLLKIVAEAKKNGVPVFVDNPLYFKNPPILVPDGTKRIEAVIDPFVDQKEREVDNFKEDVKGAMKVMLYETIKVTHK